MGISWACWGGLSWQPLWSLAGTAAVVQRVSGFLLSRAFGPRPAMPPPCRQACFATVTQSAGGTVCLSWGTLIGLGSKAEDVRATRHVFAFSGLPRGASGQGGGQQ